MLGKIGREIVFNQVLEEEEHPTPTKKARLRIGSRPSLDDGPGEKRTSRSKPRLSCAECRRLKLKCDRVFPCQTCCKRGVADICPRGSLTSGQGSRFILANTEKLHAKILQMRSRIQALEDALKVLHPAHSSEPHPLLNEELLAIKSSADLYGVVVPQPEQASNDHSENNGVEECGHPLQAIQGSVDEKSSDTNVSAQSPTNLADQSVSSRVKRRLTSLNPEVPHEVLQLSRSFPASWSINAQIRGRIRELLPSRSEAESLCQQARINVLALCNPDSNETSLPNLLHHVYVTPLDSLCSRRLGAFLMVLAIGTVVDLHQPSGCPTAEAYYHLARASICEIPLMEKPNFDLLNALFLVVLYLVIISGDHESLSYAWTLMGTTAKLAQSIGFHHDCCRSGKKFIPEELDKQRALFWGLMTLDCRLSLALCRSPCLPTLQVDLNIPSYIASEQCTDGHLYHEWRHSFLLKCIQPILQSSLSKTPPDYSSIIKLDRAVRDFPVPYVLDTFKYHGTRMAGTQVTAMQRAVVTTSLDIALLHLHRTYSTTALSGSQKLTISNDYMPSILATFSSAYRLIETLESFYNQEPLLCSRFTRFWSNAFSATVTLWLIASRTSCKSLLSCTLQAMRQVCRVFQRVSSVPYACNALPHVAKLMAKTREHLLNVDKISVDDSRRTTPTDMLHGLTTFENLHPGLLMHLEQILGDGDQVSMRHESSAGFEALEELLSPVTVSPNADDGSRHDGGARTSMESSPPVQSEMSYTFDFAEMHMDNPTFVTWF